jgi:alpha-galactosidase
MTITRLLILTVPLLAPLATIHAAAAPKPLRAFILAGQSNMDGNANVSTIDFLGEDKEHGDLLRKFKPDGRTLVTRDDVWVAHRGVHGKLGPGYGARKSDDTLGNCIGPEYAFGCFMGEAMEEQILLIKYAVGGQSLYQNFRPPSAGLPEPLPPKTKPEDFGNQYRALIGCRTSLWVNFNRTSWPWLDSAERFR